MSTDLVPVEAHLAEILAATRPLTPVRLGLEEAEGVEARNALSAELEAEWAAESQPWEAAANIILDDVIDPRETRDVIAQAIDFAWGSRPRVSKRGT